MELSHRIPFHGGVGKDGQRASPAEARGPPNGASVSSSGGALSVVPLCKWSHFADFGDVIDVCLCECMSLCMHVLVDSQLPSV